MITMNELVDLRMQQHIAQEIYRQQIMQRIPDPFPTMLPLTMPRHVIMPPRVSLPGVEATLQNDDLWQQFHQIGTEMIITKSGRRMFPSMRLSLAGLDDESNYCVLLEMVPIGDCRYKFSGSQWVPAGGAEPQSPQRMFLHPDSPATGAHWQTQPILFNKVKLTNNTLDNNGHIVLASMHKYQPRLHVIRTSDLAQIPWAPQQAFLFPETEFVAVTAYQNDRITKLKIDNNPFAKGFRETGQSRSKRKMSSSPVHEQPEQGDQQQQQQHSNHMSPTKSAAASARPSICSSDKPAEQMLSDLDDGPQIKRMRSNGSACSISSFEEVVIGTEFSSGNSTSSGNSSPSRTSATTAGAGAGAGAAAATATANIRTIYPAMDSTASNNHNNSMIDNISQQQVNIGSASSTSSLMHHFQQNMQSLLRPSLVDLACSYFARPQPVYPPQHMYGNARFLDGGLSLVGDPSILLQLPMPGQLPMLPAGGVLGIASNVSNVSNSSPTLSPPTRLSSLPFEASADGSEHQLPPQQKQPILPKEASLIGTPSPPKKKSFSISAILDGSS